MLTAINCVWYISVFLRLNPVFLIEYVLKGLNTATAAGRQVNSNLEHQSWIESSNGHCWPAEPSTSDSISPGPWTVLSLGNTALVATLLHTSTDPNPTPIVGNSQICIFGHFWPPQKSHLERSEKKSEENRLPQKWPFWGDTQCVLHTLRVIFGPFWPFSPADPIEIF